MIENQAARGLMWIAMLSWAYAGTWAAWTAARTWRPRYVAFALACYGSAVEFGLRLEQLHPWATNVLLTAGLVAGVCVFASVLVQQSRLRAAGR